MKCVKGWTSSKPESTNRAKRNGHSGLFRPNGPGAPSAGTPIELRLYVAGQTLKSLAALTNLKRICEEYLRGRYRLQVIDVIESPQLAQGDQILAVPTLVRRLPQPMHKIIGDLSDTVNRPEQAPAVRTAPPA